MVLVPVGSAAQSREAGRLGFGDDEVTSHGNCLFQDLPKWTVGVTCSPKHPNLAPISCRSGRRLVDPRRPRYFWSCDRRGAHESLITKGMPGRIRSMIDESPHLDILRTAKRPATERMQHQRAALFRLDVETLGVLEVVGGDMASLESLTATTWGPTAALLSRER